MAAEHRVSRKQLLKEPDAFQVASSRFMERLLQNRVALLVLLGGLIILAGVIGFIQSNKAGKNLEMERLYFEMTQIRDQAKDQSPDEILKNLQVKFQEMDEGEPKRRARLLLADAYYRNQQYGDAVQIYSEAKISAGSDPLITALASQGLAHSLEAQKDYKQAIAAYKSIIDSPGSLPLFYVYLGLARSYEQSGDPQNAILVLRDMQAKFPGHDDRARVDTLLQRLEAKP